MVLGGATSFLLTLEEDVTLADSGYFGTIALWGTLGGWGAGKTLNLNDRGTRWLTLAGESVGLAVAGLTLPSSDWSAEDVLLANSSARTV